MSNFRSWALRALAAALIVGTLALLAAVLAGLFEHTPEGPAPIAWDHETCAECHMHIGHPAFAAQLRTRAGEVVSFDDPGCLLRYLERERPDVRAMYFHDFDQDRWLTRDEVAFLPVPGEQTPMGYGLSAVKAGTPGALDFDAAYRAVTQQERPGDGGRR